MTTTNDIRFSISRNNVRLTVEVAQGHYGPEARLIEPSGRVHKGRIGDHGIQWMMPQYVPDGIERPILDRIKRERAASRARDARVRRAGIYIEVLTTTGGATWDAVYGPSAWRMADEGGSHPHRHLAVAEAVEAALRQGLSSVRGVSAEEFAAEAKRLEQRRA